MCNILEILEHITHHIIHHTIHYITHHIIYIIIISIIMLILPFICEIKNSSNKRTQENRKPIKIEENNTLAPVEKAQKQIEISSNFLISNGQIIMWTRGIILTILMAIVGYTLKEYYLDYNRYVIHTYRNEIVLLLFIVVFISFILEFFIQAQQTFLINRVSQLDEAINEKILSGCSNQLQKIFVAKNKIDIDYFNIGTLCAIYYNAVRAPTFFVFYSTILTFLLLYYSFL